MGFGPCKLQPTSTGTAPSESQAVIIMQDGQPNDARLVSYISRAVDDDATGVLPEDRWHLLTDKRSRHLLHASNHEGNLKMSRFIDPTKRKRAQNVNNRPRSISTINYL